MTHNNPFLSPWIPRYDGNVVDAEPEGVADLDEYDVEYEILAWGNGVMRVRLPPDPPIEVVNMPGTVRFDYAPWLKGE